MAHYLHGSNRCSSVSARSHAHYFIFLSFFSDMPLCLLCHREAPRQLCIPCLEGIIAEQEAAERGSGIPDGDSKDVPMDVYEVSGSDGDMSELDSEDLSEDDDADSVDLEDFLRHGVEPPVSSP